MKIVRNKYIPFPGYIPSGLITQGGVAGASWILPIITNSNYKNKQNKQNVKSR